MASSNQNYHNLEEEVDESDAGFDRTITQPAPQVDEGPEGPGYFEAMYNNPGLYHEQAGTANRQTMIYLRPNDARTSLDDIEWDHEAWMTIQTPQPAPILPRTRPTNEVGPSGPAPRCPLPLLPGQHTEEAIQPIEAPIPPIPPIEMPMQPPKRQEEPIEALIRHTEEQEQPMQAPIPPADQPPAEPSSSKGVRPQAPRVAPPFVPTAIGGPALIGGFSRKKKDKGKGKEKKEEEKGKGKGKEVQEEEEKEVKERKGGFLKRMTSRMGLGQSSSK